jgi:hypothetical protein
MFIHRRGRRKARVGLVIAVSADRCLLDWLA